MSATRLAIGNAPRRLEALLHAPATAPRGGVVLCHPHPQYGGDMDNNVVAGVAHVLEEVGFVALRFNFGGVGASEGSYGDGREEQRDVGAAMAALATRTPEALPLAIVGYSFGAWVGTLAARELPRVARVVAIGPPLVFFDWDAAATLRQPLAVVVGDRDQYCAPDALRRFAAALRVAVTTIVGADHFFGGREREVGEAVLTHLTDGSP